MGVEISIYPSRTRFIPAPAGNGHGSPAMLVHQPVHPRACGEWSVFASDNASENGSSPRLRGMVYCRAGNIKHSRFIPAPAGNGLTRRGPRKPHAVHPRACGEWDRVWARNMCARGSSPRLRGMGTLLHHEQTLQRFIPAPAGNGRLTRRESSPIPVHPRACGEWSCQGLRMS